MFTYLLAAMAVIAGGSVLYPAWRATHAAPPPLTVRYKNGAPATARVAQPWFEVVNTSSRTVRLADVAIRYYFTQDASASYGYNCIKAALGCSNISARINALADPTPTADHYLEFTFSTASGSLAPGAKSGAIGLQLYPRDGMKLDQRNDRSFNAASTTFQPSKLVTAYLDGHRVWGDEPTGHATAFAQGASPTAPAARPAPEPEPGIVFDDFHYSGPDDPALRAHGWLVRTSPGGPGVPDTWSAAGISFPADKDATGGQVLQLQATTDGTRAGTQQSEIQSGNAFFTGTYAARVHFDDKPIHGPNGDHINEAFYTISPNNSLYSELDDEYEPNGGWGTPGPRLDNVSWYSAVEGDRVAGQTFSDLQGWHTLLITAAHGVVTYSVDGRTVFRSSGRYYPREEMSVDFNNWFVDLPFHGPRTWDMKVNWFYYNASKAESLTEVQKAVKGLYGSGTNYVNTLAEQ